MKTKNHTLKVNHIKLCLVIGFGYWKDIYGKDNEAVSGFTHNIIFPFIRMQFGKIYLEVK